MLDTERTLNWAADPPPHILIIGCFLIAFVFGERDRRLRNLGVQWAPLGLLSHKSRAVERTAPLRDAVVLLESNGKRA